MKTELFALLILGCGLANRLWGSAWFSGNKIVAAPLFGTIVGAAIYLSKQDLILSGIFAAISAGLYFFGRVWSHGVYFCCFNPGLLSSDSMSKEGIGWIDAICNKIVPNVLTKSAAEKRLWGFIGMSLRGLYYVPLIASLSYFNILALPLSAFTLFIGAIYDVQYEQPQSWWIKQYQVPAAEFLTGALLGAIIACPILLSH